MNSKIAVICFAVLLVVALAEGKDGKGKGKGKGKGHHMKCLGENINFTETGKTAFKECAKDSKKEKEGSEDEEDGEKKKGKGFKHNKCFFDCIYRKLEYINSDGKLDGDKIDAGIKEAYPKDAQEGILADEKACREKVTEKLTTDDECKTFQEYGKCHHQAIRKNCKKEE